MNNNIAVDRDEWLDIWNGTVELRFQVKTLESKLFRVEQRLAALENPKEVK